MYRIQILVDSGCVVEMYASGGKGYMAHVRWGSVEAEAYAESWHEMPRALDVCEEAITNEGFRRR